MSSSDTGARTRVHPPPCPVSCLSRSTPIQVLPEVGLGLAVAYVRAQQLEQQEVMWGPEQEEGAGAEVRGMGLGKEVSLFWAHCMETPQRPGDGNWGQDRTSRPALTYGAVGVYAALLLPNW